MLFLQLKKETDGVFILVLAAVNTHMSQSQFFTVNGMHVFSQLTLHKQHFEQRQEQVSIQVIKICISVGSHCQWNF